RHRVPELVVPHPAVQPDPRGEGQHGTVLHDAAVAPDRRRHHGDVLLVPGAARRRPRVQAAGLRGVHAGLRPGRDVRAGRLRKLDEPHPAGRVEPGQGSGVPVPDGHGPHPAHRLPRAWRGGGPLRHREQLPQPVGHLAELRGGRVSVLAQSAELAIQRFLAQECLALDEKRYRDWLAMFAEDGRYEVPVRVTREKDAEWDLSPKSRIFDDTKKTLEIRVRRLETDFAWAEQPPSRTRHHLSNILADPADDPGTYLVRSNCLIYRSRGDQPTYDLVSAQRRDLIRENGDSFLFVHRWAAIDQSTVGSRNLSFFI